MKEKIIKASVYKVVIGDLLHCLRLYKNLGPDY